MTTQSSSISSQSNLLTFGRTSIYSKVDKSIPNSRDGETPQYLDLIYHPSNEGRLKGFMTYTGDFRKVYKSHTVVSISKDKVVVVLEVDPEYMGELKDIFTDSIEIVPFSSYMYKDEA